MKTVLKIIYYKLISYYIKLLIGFRQAYHMLLYKTLKCKSV